jgi:hypothetical protein
MFGRELKNETYLGLWKFESRKLARDLLAVVADESVGLVASVAAAGDDGSEHALELLLLPLSHRGVTDSRVLGALVPTDGAHWLGETTLGLLTLGTLRYVGPTPMQRLETPAARPAGRIRHGFTVYDGGQA